MLSWCRQRRSRIPGHWGTLAGHDHWIALGILGVAGLDRPGGDRQRPPTDRDRVWQHYDEPEAEEQRGMSRIGVMICGHGSRSQAAVEEFAVLAETSARRTLPGWPVEYGYLEFANPVIRDGLDKPARGRAATTFSRCRGCCSPPCTRRTIFRRS